MRGVDFARRTPPDYQLMAADAWLKQNVRGFDLESCLAAMKNVGEMVHATTSVFAEFVDLLGEMKDIHAAIKRLSVEYDDPRIDELRLGVLECWEHMIDKYEKLDDTNAKTIAWSHWWSAATGAAIARVKRSRARRARREGKPGPTEL